MTLKISGHINFAQEPIQATEYIIKTVGNFSSSKINPQID